MVVDEMFARERPNVRCKRRDLVLDSQASDLDEDRRHRRRFFEKDQSPTPL